MAQERILAYFAAISLDLNANFTLSLMLRK
jgi:hypothetical protein